jgi:carotenoid cleavage dioxygenase
VRARLFFRDPDAQHVVMAAPLPTDNPYLRGGFEPIRFECDCADLIVEGALPPDLAGCLYRIGPNPQYAPRLPYNPLLGDGMIHAFTFGERRVSYRNRWVRTEQWQQERSAGRALFATSGNPRDADPSVAGLATNGAANTNLVWHAARLLALEEGHAPVAIDPDSLATLGSWDFAGQLPGNLTAHPKLDPLSGEMLAFANFPGRDYSGAIELYQIDRGGHLSRRQRIQAPFPAFVHDFAITRSFVVFIVCPLTVSIERARRGASPVAWEGELGNYIGVVPRPPSSGEPQWFAAPASMVWHLMNAFDDQGAVVIDGCQQEAAAFASITGAAPEPAQLQQFLTRWRVFPASGDVRTQRLSETVCEYPRLDERYLGRPYRYGYVACGGGPGTGDPFHRAVGRFDHVTGRMDVYDFGRRNAVSEPVFVCGSEQCEEGEGHLLTVVYDEARNASHLALLDAQDLGKGPAARVFLDHRVPMGFHGLWRPASLDP